MKALEKETGNVEWGGLLRPPARIVPRRGFVPNDMCAFFASGFFASHA